MKYQAILFDLDGTLLPMHEPTFVACYCKALQEYLAPAGVTLQQVERLLGGSLGHVFGNDGSCTNKQAFAAYYKTNASEMGISLDVAMMEDFYRTDFDQKLRASCGLDPDAAMVVSRLKKSRVQMIVATNPVFPPVATYARLHWAGLEPNDFAEITTYENYHYCKPNPDYYRELFARMGLEPQKCLMIGNNVAEDMIVRCFGMDVFLITRDLINRKNEDISGIRQGTLADALAYIEQQK